jgi:hypothetical protein
VLITLVELLELLAVESQVPSLNRWLGVNLIVESSLVKTMAGFVWGFLERDSALGLIASFIFISAFVGLDVLIFIFIT